MNRYLGKIAPTINNIQDESFSKVICSVSKQFDKFCINI